MSFFHIICLTTQNNTQPNKHLRIITTTSTVLVIVGKDENGRLPRSFNVNRQEFINSTKTIRTKE